MARSDVDIRLRLLGAAKFKKDAATSASSLTPIGTKADVTGRKVQTLGSRMATFGGKTKKAFGGMAGHVKSLVGFGAAFAGIRGVQESVSVTEDFSKTVFGLQKNLGFSNREASDWAGIAASRNIETKSLNISLATLVKQQDAANQGGAVQVDLFKRLGIGQKELARTDPSQLLGKIAGGFDKLGPGTERTALMSRLLGRNWQTLAPVLRDGNKGIEEQRKLMRKYGVQVGGKTLKSTGDLIAAQREQKIATLGLQLALGQELVPMLLDVVRKTSQFIRQFRRGKGTAGILKDALGDLTKVLKTVVDWFAKLPPNVQKGLVILLLLAGSVSKLMFVFKGLFMLVKGGLAIFRALVVVINAVRFALAILWIAGFGPAILVVAAILAIAAVFVILYMKVGWFRRAVQATFAWIKSHWKLLLAILTGPIGAAVILIISHFDKIKHAVGAAWDWIKRAWGNVKSFFAGVGRAMADGVKSGINAIITAWNSLDMGIHISVPGWVPGVGGKGFNVDDIFPDIGTLATGGAVSRAGAYVTGERGPELLRLPTGTDVTPFPQGPLAAMAGGVQTIRVPVYLDGRPLTEVVAKNVRNAESRR